MTNILQYNIPLFTVVRQQILHIYTEAKKNIHMFSILLRHKNSDKITAYYLDRVFCYMK